MSIGKDITVALIHGIEGVATGAPGREGVTTMLRDMKQAFLKGDKDILIRNDWAATAEAQKKIMNMSWLDRQVIAFKHWIIELFSGPKLLIEKGQVRLREGYEDLVNFAQKHFKTKVAAAAAEAKAAAAHMDELKNILGDDAAVARLIRQRSRGVTPRTTDPVPDKVLDALMGNIHDSSLAKLGLNPAELKAFRLEIAQRAVDNSKLMLTDASGNLVRTTFVDSGKQLHRLATVQILEERGLLGKFIGDNKVVNEAVEKAMGFKPQLMGRTNHEFSQLTDPGKKHVLDLLKKERDEIINGAKVVENGKVKIEKGVAVRATTGVKGEQLIKVKKLATDDGLALTEKQAEALAKQKAEYLTDVKYGVIPEDYAFEDTIKGLMRDHHTRNTEVVTRKLTQAHGKQQAIEVADQAKMSTLLNEHGFAVTPEALVEIKTKEHFTKYITDLREAA